MGGENLSAEIARREQTKYVHSTVNTSPWQVFPPSYSISESKCRWRARRATHENAEHVARRARHLHKRFSANLDDHDNEPKPTKTKLLFLCSPKPVAFTDG